MEKYFMTIFVIFLILVIIIILLKYNILIPSYKPYLWTYWEIKNDTNKIPDYINLCFETFYRHCSNSYQIVILDQNNITDYLPNLRTDLNNLLLPQKTDYIRIALLYYYGGLWLDADTIVMKDLKPIIQKMEHYDFVGFGCSYQKCFGNEGYSRPSNWAMACRPNGILMRQVFKKIESMLNQKINNYEYFDLGKKLLWQEIDELLKNPNGYEYYHYSVNYDGSRNNHGNWITPDLIFQSNINLIASQNDLLLVPLANNTYCGNDPKYNWFCKLSRNDILKNNYFISSLFRKSLKLN